MLVRKAFEEQPKAQGIQKTLTARERNIDWTSVSMLGWIEHIFQAVTLNDRNLVAMIMWLLWCRRNMLLHDGKRWDCAELIQKACDLSSEYLHAISCSEDIRSQHTTEPAIWRPPTGACIKVNVDAAKLLSANAAGFALIVGMVTVLGDNPQFQAN